MQRTGRFTVKVIAQAKRESVEQNIEGFTVRVHAPAREGKANERLIELIAEFLNIAKSRVRIDSGHASKIKRIHIS
jgi:uncharacterized protein